MKRLLGIIFKGFSPTRPSFSSIGRHNLLQASSWWCVFVAQLGECCNNLTFKLSNVWKDARSISIPSPPPRFTCFWFFKELKSSSGKSVSLCSLEKSRSTSLRNQQIRLLFTEHLLGAKCYIYCPQPSQKLCLVDALLHLEMSELRLNGSYPTSNIQ